MHYHGGEIPTIPPISDAVAARTFAAFDVIFTNTAFSARQVVERGGDERKVVVLPVGFALDDFHPPPGRAYRAGGVLRLLAAGRVSVEKGFSDLLVAVRRLVAGGLSDVHLDLAGDGPGLSELRAFVSAHGLEAQVEFLGRLSHEALIERMGRVDALVLSSRPVGNWAETQACVLQEAMLMRTPVIAARTGGVLESIPTVLHPVSPESGDPESIADAVARFAALDSARLEELGRSTEAFARSRYDVTALDDRLLATLELGSGTVGRTAGVVP
jgi:D-inositol-3-phosphate glycosyltransferase